MLMTAICPDHGPFDFETGITSSQLQMIRGRTQCLECGKTSEIVDGDYVRHGDHMHVTLRPTPAQMLRLQTVVEWASEAVKQPDADAEKIAEKVKRAVEKESPALSRALNAALSTKGASALAWLGFFFAVFQFIVGAQNDQDINEDLVRYVIEQAEKADQQETGQQGTTPATDPLPPTEPPAPIPPG